MGKQAEGAQTIVLAHKAKCAWNEIWIRNGKEKKRQENNNAKA